MVANAAVPSVRHAPRQPVRSVRRKLAVRTREAAALIGIGLATFERLDAAGKVPTGAKLWNVRELRAWVDAGMPSRCEWTPLWKAIRESRARR